ncbi:MAG: beta-glucosidase BglX [Prevotella sp.]|jgi:beta-glucosidase|nr:beta-glucosidase BglX [Prevotella sp.]MCI1282773.1 beta-glucosidase BglX [Prevotella sp.]
MRKVVILTLVMSCFATIGFSQKKPMRQFIDDLMQQMTVEEKIGQLNLLPGADITTGQVINSPLGEQVQAGNLGAILNVKGVEKIKKLQEIAVKKTRLGIPLLFGQDVIHGYETVFPIPLAQACSWDLKAIEAGARVAASEATASGINWIYSPMVDVALDARWGRVAEGAGEDPFLTSRVGEALIRGYQGNYSDHNVMACVKHYALYGAAEAGRDYNTVDMSRVRMYNQYFPPYKAAAEAGAGSFMSSFNVVDGVPATGNRWLLTDVLRNEWKYDGFLVTDYGSISEMTVHGVGDLKSCAAQALKAGTDMDMCSEAFVKNLKACLADGSISMADIDRACRRVLEAKYKLGLFDNPYRFCDVKREKTDLYTAANRLAARNMAAETFVLLKNEQQLLPLKKQGTIALIGPLADTRNNLVGSWSTGDKPEKYTTLKEAMEHAVAGKATVVYAQGSNIYLDETQQKSIEFGRPIPRGDNEALLKEALQVAQKADVIVAALGEMAEMSGECASRSDLNLPDAQMRLLQQLAATGKPIVLLNFAGRPTILKWESEHIPAIMNVWFGGSELGDAICDVLFGDKVPTGKLVNSMPQNMGQLPLYYNHLNTGRPVPDGAKEFRKYQSNYLDVRNDALYPFGYGLSYTSYKYGDVVLSAPKISTNGTVTASVTVTNVGQRDGDEIVELYIHDKVASIARPVKELKGFQRVHLNAGESKVVSFEITPEHLQFYDLGLKAVVEPGEFEIMIGSSSRDVKSALLTVD